MPSLSPSFDGQAIRHQLYTLVLSRYAAIRRNYYEHPELHKLINRSHELWSPLIALAAFFEEEGSVAGLLSSIEEAAARDNLISEGKSLSDREEALLQVLEVMTRGQQVVAVKARDIREQVQKLLDIPDERLGNPQWIGHLLKNLQLTDRERSQRQHDGMQYVLDRAQVLDMMKRYHVRLIETESANR